MFPQCMAIKVYIVFSGQYGQLYLCVLILPSDRLNLSFIGQRWLGGSYCCFWTLNTVTITGDRVNRSKPRPVGLHHYFTLWPIIFQQPRLFRGYVPFSSCPEITRLYTESCHIPHSHSKSASQDSKPRKICGVSPEQQGFPSSLQPHFHVQLVQSCLYSCSHT